MVLIFPDFIIVIIEVIAVVATLRVGAILWVLSAGSRVWFYYKCSGMTSKSVLLSLKDLDFIRDIKVCLAINYFTYY